MAREFCPSTYVDRMNLGDDETPTHLVRFLFTLPDPIGLPDGYTVSATVGDGSNDPRADDPFVILHFHQVDASTGRTAAAHEAVTIVASRIDGEVPPDEKRELLQLGAEFTVVEAVTTSASPDTVPDADAESPARWMPRADPFMRCLTLAQSVVRAYKQATESLCRVPTYVLTPSPVLSWSGNGASTTVDHEGEKLILVRPTEDWQGPSVLMLDHMNLPDSFRDDVSEDVLGRVAHWHDEQRHRYPLDLWRERFTAARRALFIEGDTASAVTLANTSCEVLLDAVLAILMWEEGMSVAAAAPSFEEGKALRRVKQDISHRLGGNWSTGAGPVGDWVTALYKLRHRVVHAGYTPTIAEAETGIEVAHHLQRFVFDRIAARRTTYPRSALTTVAEEGLRRRDLWSGKIKRFASEVAPTEPSWRESYARFYGEVVEAVAGGVATPPPTTSGARWQRSLLAILYSFRRAGARWPGRRT